MMFLMKIKMIDELKTKLSKVFRKEKVEEVCQ